MNPLPRVTSAQLKCAVCAASGKPAITQTYSAANAASSHPLSPTRGEKIRLETALWGTEGINAEGNMTSRFLESSLRFPP
jgi:hypothetical protein